jgi:hypothetical protein
MENINPHKDITTFNEKGQYHGYFEKYHPNGKLWWKGNYINDLQIGYHERYFNGKILYRKYIIL